MNPRPRRGLIHTVLSVVAALLVFVGVSTYVSNVNSKVGPMITVYHVNKDLPAFTTLVQREHRTRSGSRAWARIGAEVFVAG